MTDTEILNWIDANSADVEHLADEDFGWSPIIHTYWQVISGVDGQVGTGPTVRAAVMDAVAGQKREAGDE